MQPLIPSASTNNIIDLDQYIETNNTNSIYIEDDLHLNIYGIHSNEIKYKNNSFNYNASFIDFNTTLDNYEIQVSFVNPDGTNFQQEYILSNLQARFLYYLEKEKNPERLMRLIEKLIPTSDKKNIFFFLDLINSECTITSSQKRTRFISVLIKTNQFFCFLEQLQSNKNSYIECTKQETEKYNEDLECLYDNFITTLTKENLCHNKETNKKIIQNSNILYKTFVIENILLHNSSWHKLIPKANRSFEQLDNFPPVITIFFSNITDMFGNKVAKVILPINYNGEEQICKHLNLHSIRLGGLRYRLDNQQLNFLLALNNDTDNQKRFDRIKSLTNHLNIFYFLKLFQSSCCEVFNDKTENKAFFSVLAKTDVISFIDFLNKNKLLNNITIKQQLTYNIEIKSFYNIFSEVIKSKENKYDYENKILLKKTQIMLDFLIIENLIHPDSLWLTLREQKSLYHFVYFKKASDKPTQNKVIDYLKPFSAIGPHERPLITQGEEKRRKTTETIETEKSDFVNFFERCINESFSIPISDFQEDDLDRFIETSFDNRPILQDARVINNNALSTIPSRQENPLPFPQQETYHMQSMGNFVQNPNVINNNNSGFAVSYNNQFIATSINRIFSDNINNNSINNSNPHNSQINPINFIGYSTILSNLTLKPNESSEAVVLNTMNPMQFCEKEQIVVRYKYNKRIANNTYELSKDQTTFLYAMEKESANDERIKLITNLIKNSHPRDVRFYINLFLSPCKKGRISSTFIDALVKTNVLELLDFLKDHSDPLENISDEEKIKYNKDLNLLTKKYLSALKILLKKQSGVKLQNQLKSIIISSSILFKAFAIDGVIDKNSTWLYLNDSKKITELLLKNRQIIAVKTTENSQSPLS